MKYLAAYVAAASAASYTVCQFTQTFHATGDTSCATYSDGTEVQNVLVDQCTYSLARTAWFKVTSCSTVAVEQEWHAADGSCGTANASLATLAKVNFTAVAVCLEMADTGSVATFRTKIASLAGDTNAELCGATWTFYKASGASDTTCASATAEATASSPTGTGDTAAEAGLGPAAGTAWIKSKCYKFGQRTTNPDQQQWWWNISACALTSTTDYTVGLFVEATGTCATANAVDVSTAVQQSNDWCFTEANAGGSGKFDQTGIAGTADELAFGFSGVTNTDTVAQPVAPTTATAAATTTAATTTTDDTETTDGAKTLVAGAIAAISMMYL